MNRQSTTYVATSLLPSPPLKRLVDQLHDLIIISCERSISPPGKQLELVRFQYVSDENNDEKCSMLFDVLVKVHGQLGNIPLRLQFTVGSGEL